MVENRSVRYPIALICSLLLFTFALLAPRLTVAQVSGATLSGTITDSTGAVVPKAEVAIKNEGTGETRSVVTDAAGFYSAPNLVPGKYDITVTAAGFSTAVQNGITLTVGAQQLLNISMKIGQVSQKVEVTAAAPAVQLASSDVSGVIQENTVSQLPLNGRDWTSLATLQPGVDSVGSIQANTGSKDRARRGYGLQMTISGARPTQNNYRIDGISVNDYSNGGPGSVEGSTLGVDAVQEFSVITSNYSAEYGRTSGGVINAVTKAGTNSYHGDAYEFLRNSALDSRNYFDPAAIPEFRRNQFGASLGGPIQKNKTFFFADYEGLRENQGITTLDVVPSQAARQGTLCSIPQSGPGGCSTHTVTGAFNPDPTTGIDTAVLPYLGLWGLPNDGLLGNGDTGLYAFNGGHITSENFGTARLDHTFSNSDNIFASFQYDGAFASQPDPANDVLVGNDTERRYVAIEETHIFSSQLVNSARFGFNRSVHTSDGIKAINPLASNPALGESAGADNPQIDVPGLVSIQPGLNQVERVNFFENSFQGYDDVFVIKGIHSLKFGFAVERIQTNAFNPAPVGEFPFGALSDPNPANNGFFQNNPLVLFAPVPTAPFLQFGFRSTIFGGYAQDDIRLRSNLTLNVGLRYEMNTVPTEIRGRLSALRSPYNQSLQTAAIGNGIFQNPTLRNFEPRFGFAWDPFHNGKTSVRGGFGMFDVLPLPYLLGQFATNAAPFTENASANSLPSGSFPTQAFNILAANALAGVSLRVPYIQPNPSRNYVMQWNLNVQRELAPNLTLMLGYVGSRGVHMIFRADDINTVLPLQTSAPPYLWPAPGTGNQISPLIGQMDTLQWNNDSFFDGLEVHVQKRMSHGFEIDGSYTWSRAIDGGDGSIASDSFVSSIPSLLFFLPKYRRAASDFNVDQNLTVNYTWNVPTPQSFTGPATWVARGWVVGGILTMRTGLPFTPLIGGDPLGLKNTSPFAYPDRVRGQGCGSLVNPGNVNNYIKLQCFALPTATPAIAAQCVPFSNAAANTCSNLLGDGGRNEIFGPGMVNFDFSLFKENKITENKTLEFRAEFFNVFNHTNFNPPIDNSALFDQTGTPIGSAGVIDQTSTFSRQIQFALKFIF